SATKKASATGPAPSSAAVTTSRTKPSTRLARVRPPTERILRSTAPDLVAPPRGAQAPAWTRLGFAFSPICAHGGPSAIDARAFRRHGRLRDAIAPPPHPREERRARVPFDRDMTDLLVRADEACGECRRLVRELTEARAATRESLVRLQRALNGLS